jgi:hypothetical protein
VSPSIQKLIKAKKALKWAIDEMRINPYDGQAEVRKDKVDEALNLICQIIDSSAITSHKNEESAYEQSPEVRKALYDYHQRRAQAQLEAKVLYGGDCFLEDEHGNSIAAPDGCPEEER